MAIEDVLPTILIITLIYFLVRWLTKSKSTGEQDSIPGVTASMVETVHTAFPHIPLPNTIYHLSKSRSPQATSEEILERGFLPAPPTGFHIPSTLFPIPVAATSQSSYGDTSSKKTSTTRQSLIERYGLNAKIPSRKGKERDPDPDSGLDPEGASVQESARAGGDGKARWGDTREKRESELRERKERMILEARRRLLEKQKGPDVGA